jgi:hypothetical protein
MVLSRKKGVRGTRHGKKGFNKKKASEKVVPVPSTATGGSVDEDTQIVLEAVGESLDGLAAAVVQPVQQVDRDARAAKKEKVEMVNVLKEKVAILLEKNAVRVERTKIEEKMLHALEVCQERRVGLGFELIRPCDVVEIMSEHSAKTMRKRMSTSQIETSAANRKSRKLVVELSVARQKLLVVEQSSKKEVIRLTKNLTRKVIRRDIKLAGPLTQEIVYRYVKDLVRGSEDSGYTEGFKMLTAKLQGYASSVNATPKVMSSASSSSSSSSSHHHHHHHHRRHHHNYTYLPQLIELLFEGLLPNISSGNLKKLVPVASTVGKWVMYVAEIDQEALLERLRSGKYVFCVLCDGSGR